MGDSKQGLREEAYVEQRSRQSGNQSIGYSYGPVACECKPKPKKADKVAEFLKRNLNTIVPVTCIVILVLFIVFSILLGTFRPNAHKSDTDKSSFSPPERRQVGGILDPSDIHRNMHEGAHLNGILQTNAPNVTKLYVTDQDLVLKGVFTMRPLSLITNYLITTEKYNDKLSLKCNIPSIELENEQNNLTFITTIKNLLKSMNGNPVKGATENNTEYFIKDKDVALKQFKTNHSIKERDAELRSERIIPEKIKSLKSLINKVVDTLNDLSGFLHSIKSSFYLPDGIKHFTVSASSESFVEEHLITSEKNNFLFFKMNGSEKSPYKQALYNTVKVYEPSNVSITEIKSKYSSSSKMEKKSEAEMLDNKAIDMNNLTEHTMTVEKIKLILKEKNDSYFTRKRFPHIIADKLPSESILKHNSFNRNLSNEISTATKKSYSPILEIIQRRFKNETVKKEINVFTLKSTQLTTPQYIEKQHTTCSLLKKTLRANTIHNYTDTYVTKKTTHEHNLDEIFSNDSMIKTILSKQMKKILENLTDTNNLFSRKNSQSFPNEKKYLFAKSRNETVQHDDIPNKMTQKQQIIGGNISKISVKLNNDRIIIPNVTKKNDEIESYYKIHLDGKNYNKYKIDKNEEFPRVNFINKNKKYNYLNQSEGITIEYQLHDNAKQKTTTLNIMQSDTPDTKQHKHSTDRTRRLNDETKFKVKFVRKINGHSN